MWKLKHTPHSSKTRQTPPEEWPVVNLINAPPQVLALVSKAKLAHVQRLWRSKRRWSPRRVRQELERVAVARAALKETRHATDGSRIVVDHPGAKARLRSPQSAVASAIQASLRPLSGEPDDSWFGV